MKESLYPGLLAGPRPAGFEEALAHSVAASLVAFLEEGVTLQEAALILLAENEGRVRSDLLSFGSPIGELVVEGERLPALVLQVARRRRKEKRRTDPTLDLLRALAKGAPPGSIRIQSLSPVLMPFTTMNQLPRPGSLGILAELQEIDSIGLTARGVQSTVTAQGKITAGIIAGQPLFLWWIIDIINPSFFHSMSEDAAGLLTVAWIAILGFGMLIITLLGIRFGRGLDREAATNRSATLLAWELASGTRWNEAAFAARTNLGEGHPDCRLMESLAAGTIPSQPILPRSLAAAARLHAAGSRPEEIARWLRSRTIAEAAESPVRAYSEASLHQLATIALATAALGIMLFQLGFLYLGVMQLPGFSW